MGRKQSRKNSPGYSSTLCLASSDIGRAMAARGAATFRAEGTCMYPTIRPGDVLHIEPRSPSEISVGEIAVCRGGTYLFGHRVVAIGSQDGRDYVITKPDGTRQGGQDAPVFEDDLVGVVTGVERGGRSVDLDCAEQEHSLAARAFHECCLSMIRAKLRMKAGLLRMVEILQNLRLYGYFGGAWFRSKRNKIRFLVQVPPSLALRGVAHRVFEADTFDPRNSWEDREIGCWTLSAFLGDKAIAAGTVTAVKTQAGSWEVSGPLVRVRYRGTGLDRLLVDQAEGLVDRSQGSGPKNVR